MVYTPNSSSGLVCAINLLLSVTETFPYIELGMTPDVETYSVDLEETSSVNISFPFGTSLEPRVYVSQVKYYTEIAN